jgi:hypothetical protein
MALSFSCKEVAGLKKAGAGSSEFRVLGSEFWVQSSEFRVLSSEFNL